MSRRREPEATELPPAPPPQAELGQPKAFENRATDGPPAADYTLGAEGQGQRDHTIPGDRIPANDTHWGGK